MYPFRSESERNYHAWIGIYIASWSRVEHALYYLIMMIGKLQKKQDSLPKKSISLSQKIKRLEKTFRDDGLLAEEQDEMLTILEFVDKESLYRHDIIHGVNAEIMNREPWYTAQWRPELTQGDFNPDKVTFIDEDDLKQHVDSIQQIGFRLLGLSVRVMNLYLKNLEQDG
ncbi:hypothetical protein DET47_1324 [Shewanella putrefaciens]|nr:hypothetical protein DET47_1324 [Shewanella putrefaciens]